MRFPMPKTFKIADHVRWNSEAGWVSGVIIKKLTSDTQVKGYVHLIYPLIYPGFLVDVRLLGE